MCFPGRRGTKRKAEEVQADEEKTTEEKKDGGEQESTQDGLRVVIEHWWALK